MSQAISALFAFLAQQDALPSPGTPRSDCVVVLCGTAVIPCLRHAAALCTSLRSRHLVITGGIGHSTCYLYEAVRKESLLPPETTLEGRTEADIIVDILTHNRLLPKDLTIVTETKSTNCGENARFTVNMLKSLFSSDDAIHSIVVVQDPTMSRRTYLSFTKALREVGLDGLHVYSSSPIQAPDASLWGGERRMLTLMLGEVPRLIHYGSPAMGGKGLGFIDDSIIPTKVLELHTTLAELYPAYADR